MLMSMICARQEFQVATHFCKSTGILLGIVAGLLHEWDHRALVLTRHELQHDHACTTKCSSSTSSCDL